ncbi:dynamin-1 [Nephila pilipes]|uniref:Dynamin-1 n=1 Tax=Nephila pilipes TaxID=299642 RepID=A0A8X6ULZ3_NEPPI|nr:dynamin-1 [Nephila pilipes]
MVVQEEYDLIDAMNSLQVKLLNNGFNFDLPLPQIVVVGSQSAGKSSVLENIVGREFLPRGKGVVTRRPTLIQLYPCAEEYVVFGHKENERFENFDDVKQEILSQMPPQHTFSSVPIQVKIYSPRVLKLTLVDLPGMVRVTVDGQSESSIREVRQMILKYITPPESLILAVTPANQDLVSSDALEIASTVDPERRRTIGVLTKLDIMDEGTDARDIIENRQITLKKGWIAVLNRSQQEIDDGRDIPYILEKEKRFFSEKSCYSHMSERMGTKYLQSTLQKILKTHIQAALPEVRNKLSERLSMYEKKLSMFESNTGEGSGGKQFYIIKLVNTFIEDIVLKLIGNSELVDMKMISAGSFINFKLNTEVQRNLSLKVHPDDKEMTIIIANLSGIRGSISFPSLALDSVNRDLVSRYRIHMEDSVDCIKKILEEAVVESAAMLDRYPATKAEVLFRISRTLRKEMENTKQKLREHVEAEMFYVNLEHPDLDLSVGDSVVPAIGPTKVWQDSDSSDSNEEEDTSLPDDTVNGVGDGFDLRAQHLVKILMRNDSTQKKVKYLSLVMKKYLDIVHKQISDLTIKYILCFLIKKKSLMNDCDEDFRLKEEMQINCACLEEALDYIQAF